MPYCKVHEDKCKLVDRDGYHMHKPFEECVSSCPFPHMWEDQAQDWWDRWVYADSPHMRQKIEAEARTESKPIEPFWKRGRYV